MNSKLGIKRTAIAAAFLAASAASGLAFAIYESESNDSMATAQRLEIGPGGVVEVTAAIGNTTGAFVADVDFYFFEGSEGNLVTIDIDGGMKSNCSLARCVDTIIAIFGSGGVFHQIDDVSPFDPRSDPGSVSNMDALIKNFRLPRNGRYTVGVSSWPRHFRADGSRVSNTTSTSNGTYTLLISGVTSPLVHINIDVKPGDDGESAPINPKAKGNIPVALLSNSNFNALEVNQQSLRFGPEGNESSWLRCNKGSYVNADDKLDLVCHFDNQAAGFEPGDLEGIVRGSLNDGRRFEGRGYLKVVPVKRGQ